MTYAQLKAFHAVARFGSFTAAAQNIGLSQPAISDHIKNLEESYGTQLFTRNAKGANLTLIGKKLFAIVERLFETETEASELLSQAQMLKHGELKLGADAAVHILPQLQKFSEKFPQISIKLSRGNSLALLAKITDFSLDFAVVANKPSEAGVGSHLIRRDQLVALVTKNNKHWKNHKSTSLPELAKHTFIMREEGSTTKSSVQKYFGKAGVQVTHMIEIEGREATQEAVAHGLGVTIISTGEFTPHPKIMPLRISDCDEKMEEWLIWLESRSNLRLIDAFLRLFKESAAFL